jgi:hypothetical protein
MNGMGGNGSGGAGGGGGTGACGDSSTELARSTTVVGSVAADDTSVYFLDGIRTIVAVRKGGGAPRTVTTDLPITFFGETTILVGAGTLYIAGSSAIYTLPATGGTPTTLVTGDNLGDIITMDADFVYYSEQGPQTDGLPHGLIKKVPRAGGAAITLAENQPGPTSVMVDATTVYWENMGSPGPDLTFAKDGGVSSVAKAGGTVQVLFKETGDGKGITAASAGLVDGGTNVYFLSANIDTGGEIGTIRVPKAGGAPKKVASEAFVDGFVENGFLYGDSGDKILKMDIASGNVTDIVCLSGSASMAHDATHFYFNRREGDLFSDSGYTIRAFPR